MPSIYKIVFLTMSAGMLTAVVLADIVENNFSEQLNQRGKACFQNNS